MVAILTNNLLECYSTETPCLIVLALFFSRGGSLYIHGDAYPHKRTERDALLGY